MPMTGTGKPKKLTDESVEKMCVAIRIGMTYERACIVAGVSPRAFAYWRTEGKKAIADGRKNKYSEFMTTLSKAEAEAELNLLAKIQKSASDGIWSAAAWILAHRYPERWGSKVEMQITGDVNIKPYVSIASPDVWDEIEEGTGEKVIDSGNLLSLPEPAQKVTVINDS